MVVVGPARYMPPNQPKATHVKHDHWQRRTAWPGQSVSKTRPAHWPQSVISNIICWSWKCDAGHELCDVRNRANGLPKWLGSGAT